MFDTNNHKKILIENKLFIIIMKWLWSFEQKKSLFQYKKEG